MIGRCIRTSVGVGASPSAGQFVAADQQETLLYGTLARSGVDTRPGRVSVRVIRERPKIRLPGSAGVGLGSRSRNF